MIAYAVVEKFVSINGEGPCAGELAVFIRFRQCNLNCTYCDTKWANTKKCPAEFLTLEQLTGYVMSCGIKNVTLTGGEPLLQDHIGELTAALVQSGKRVEVETNGSISLQKFAEDPLRPVFTMDYKLPSSGMEAYMDLENLKFLQKEDTLKFVAGSEEDLECAAEIIREYGLLERCHIYFSPVFGSIDPEKIVGFMKRNRLDHTRLQLQLHKYIWDPRARGV